MRLLSRSTLVEFWTVHPDAEAALRHWLAVASAANWTQPLDVVSDFTKAKALDGERVRFDIAGGEFRLIVAFDFARGIAFLKFIGTHAEYDKVDALTVKRF